MSNCSRRLPDETALRRLLDEAALRRAAELYAQGADRRDKALWRAVLTKDCTIEGPGFRTEGREVCLRSIDLLSKMFRATTHRVQNQVVQIVGDEATGETYGTAEHLLGDADMILVWSVRYQDAWRRKRGTWRFVQRFLVVDWEETRPAVVKAVTQTGETER